MLVCRSRVGLTCPLKTHQSIAHGILDVKTPGNAAQLAFPVPAQKPFYLIHWIKSLALYQALRQEERHRSVVRPLAGFKAKRAATVNVGHRLKGAGRFEFKGGSKGVATGKTKKGSTTTINDSDRRNSNG